MNFIKYDVFINWIDEGKSFDVAIFVKILVAKQRRKLDKDFLLPSIQQ